MSVPPHHFFIGTLSGHAFGPEKIRTGYGLISFEGADGQRVWYGRTKNGEDVKLNATTHNAAWAEHHRRGLA